MVAHTANDRSAPSGPGYPWIPHEEILSLIDTYLGPRRRSGQGCQTPPTDGWEDALGRTRFGKSRQVFAEGRPYMVQDADGVLANFLSMSYAAPHLFGERLGSFEADVRQLLAALLADLIWDVYGRWNPAFIWWYSSKIRLGTLALTTLTFTADEVAEVAAVVSRRAELPWSPAVGRLWSVDEDELQIADLPEGDPARARSLAPLRSGTFCLLVQGGSVDPYGPDVSLTRLSVDHVAQGTETGRSLDPGHDFVLEETEILFNRCRVHAERRNHER
jgi:hypothetical protein